MTTVIGTNSTSVRQSSPLSSALSGASDSSSGQTISDFSSLLAALFAAPQILTPNQVPLPVSLPTTGSQQQNTNSNSSLTTSQSSVVDSLSSLLFANSLTNQTSASSTNGLASASILGQNGSNGLNTGVSTTTSSLLTSAISTLGSSSPAVLGQSTITGTATSVLGALSGQTTGSAASTTASITAASSGLSSLTGLLANNVATTFPAQASGATTANSQNGFTTIPLSSNSTPGSVNGNQPSLPVSQANSNVIQRDLGSVSSNAQSTNSSGLFTSANQTSPLLSKSAVKVAAKQTTLAEAAKAAFELANANLDAVAASLGLQQSPTPIIANTNAANTAASNSTLLNTTTASITTTNRQTTSANNNPNLNTAEISANSRFFRLSSTTSATTNSTSASTANLAAGTVSVVVTPSLTSSSVTSANAAVANTTDGLAVLQSTNVLSSPILNNGRTPGQSVILPALPQSPLVPPGGADAFPNGFYSVTGIDRPADAVSTLDGLKQIDTTAGGTALFARERSDIADLNSLLRGQEPKLTTDNSSVASNGNTFAKQVEAASNPATPAPADQPSKVLTQLADAVAERAQVIREKGSTEIRMRLDPPDLGTIDIRVHSHKGELRADITAADPAVRTMIESQLADLRSSLEKSGLDFQSFNLNSGNRSDRGGQQPDNTGSSAGFDRKTPSVAPVVVTPSAVVTPNRGSVLDVTA